MTADEATVRERVSQSRKDSEADYEVCLKIAQRYDPLTEDERQARCVGGTSVTNYNQTGLVLFTS